MFKKFVLPVFQRQKTQIPEVITLLETIAARRELTRTQVIVLTQEASHTLRNVLTVVSVVLEFEEMGGHAFVKAQEGKEDTLEPGGSPMG